MCVSMKVRKLLNVTNRIRQSVQHRSSSDLSSSINTHDLTVPKTKATGIPST